jgi:hypothetical protein
MKPLSAPPRREESSVRKKASQRAEMNNKVTSQLVIWIGVIVFVIYMTITILVISRSSANNADIDRGEEPSSMTGLRGSTDSSHSVLPDYDFEGLLMEGLPSKPRTAKANPPTNQVPTEPRIVLEEDSVATQAEQKPSREVQKSLRSSS